MKNIKIKQKIDRTTITYKLKKNEQINKMEIGVVNSGEIPGLQPMSLLDRFGRAKIRFVLSNVETAEIYLRRGLSFGMFLDFILQVSNIFSGIEAYALRIGNIESRLDCIFYDNVHKTVQMLYWPVITLDSYVLPERIFLNFGRAYECPAADRKYQDMYFRLLESRTKFELKRFRGGVENLKHMWLGDYEEEIIRPISEPTQSVYNASLIDLATQGTHELKQLIELIGRSEECNLVISEKHGVVGRKHAQIVNENGKDYIIDLQSKNGTKVNGEKLEAGVKYLLHSGDTLELGGIGGVRLQYLAPGGM